jgi:hypothetical protein
MLSRKIFSVFIVFITLFSFTATSQAGETVASLIAAGIEAICAPFAAKISASEGNFQSRSKYYCLGAFQFCPGTFELYYNGTADAFLNSPHDQVVAWTKYEKTQWGLASKYKLVSLVGTQVCNNGTCATIDPSAILMACQFGCGPKGKLANYLAGHDCDARNVKDGNLVSVCSYLLRGRSFEVSCFTGEKASQPITAGLDTPSTGCPSGPSSAGAAELELIVNGVSLRFNDSISDETIRRLIKIMKAGTP